MKVGDKYDGMTIVRLEWSAKKGLPVYLLDWRESSPASDRIISMADLPADFVQYWIDRLFVDRLRKVDRFPGAQGSIVDPEFILRVGGYAPFFRRFLEMDLGQLRAALERYRSGYYRHPVRERLLECLVDDKGVDRAGQGLLFGGAA